MSTCAILLTVNAMVGMAFHFDVDAGARKGRTMFASASTSWGLPREKCLTHDEVSSILARAKETDPRLYVFLTIGANTALRISEVLHIKAEDITDGQLRIVRRKKKVLQYEIIDIVSSLSPLLHEWATMYSDGWIFPGSAKPCWIKRSKGAPEQVCEGGHMAGRVIQRGWEILMAGLGLRMRGRGIHTLRHFAVTEFYAKHKDLRAAQTFAGHSSSVVTERYAKVLDMREKVHAMTAIL